LDIATYGVYLGCIIGLVAMGALSGRPIAIAAVLYILIGGAAVVACWRIQKWRVRRQQMRAGILRLLSQQVLIEFFPRFGV
jgi:uncharacterized membrane protein YuzA (DUF378 family)